MQVDLCINFLQPRNTLRRNMIVVVSDRKTLLLSTISKNRLRNVLTLWPEDGDKSRKEGRWNRERNLNKYRGSMKWLKKIATRMLILILFKVDCRDLQKYRTTIKNISIEC